MSIGSLTHSDKHLSEFLPTKWRQESTGIDMEQNYVTVTTCTVMKRPQMSLIATAKITRPCVLGEEWPHGSMLVVYIYSV